MKRESLRLILISDGGKVLTWERINVGGLVYWRALAILRQLATGIATMGQSWKSLGYAEPRLGSLGMLGKDLAISQNPRGGRKEQETMTQRKGILSFHFCRNHGVCALRLWACRGPIDE